MGTPMRTTLAIDDDVLERAKGLARARRVSLGEIATELMRRGLELQIGERDGLAFFMIGKNARTITSTSVHEAEDEW